MIDLEKLEALAKAATPGEDWNYDEKFQVWIEHKDGGTGFRTNKEDAAFIFAARPSTILELIEANRRLQSELDAAHSGNDAVWNEAIAAAVQKVDAHKRDASFDDSMVGALEHNSNEANIAQEIRALTRAAPTEKK